MRKMMWATLVVAVIVSPAFGQRQKGQGQGRGGFGGGGGGFALLAVKSVQEDLKLSADQVKEIDELTAKQSQALEGLEGRERFQKMAELAPKNQEAAAKVLKPEQQKRLK